ncbi:MAG: hypothetical protein SFU56_03915 [Capsulimonadales bacterium]|nr:hypothetical protein [Capsulimonadales bacterium]
MRLGILRIGAVSPAERLVADLRTADIDVVTGEVGGTATAEATRQSGILGRADCDGVLIELSADADPWLILPAVLHIGCPILLAGAGNTGRQAAELIRQTGVPFEEARAELDVPSLQEWLRAHRASERQAGIELPSKLYGNRMAAAPDRMVGVDRLRWFRQFGIVFVGPEEEAEMMADDGVLSALSRRFLSLIGDRPEREGFTEARIEEDSGRFVCRFRYHTGLPGLPEGIPTIAGDGRAAIRAACFGLDIVPVETN